MLGPQPGLVRVPTASLVTLLRTLVRGQIEAPVNTVSLTCVGLQAHSEFLMAALRDLDERAVRAVLIAVLAEREAARQRRGSADHDEAHDP